MHKARGRHDSHVGQFGPCFCIFTIAVTIRTVFFRKSSEWLLLGWCFFDMTIVVINRTVFFPKSSDVFSVILRSRDNQMPATTFTGLLARRNPGFLKGDIWRLIQPYCLQGTQIFCEFLEFFASLIATSMKKMLFFGIDGH